SNDSIDVRLTKAILGDCLRQTGDTVTFQIIVTRTDTLNRLATVVVKDSLVGPHWQYIGSSATIGSFDPLTMEWTGIDLGSADTAMLTMQARILGTAEGIICNEAWVESSTLPDIDATSGDR